MKFTKQALCGMLFLLLGCMFAASAQKPANAQKPIAIIKGMVQDSTKAEVLPYATVGLYREGNLEKPLQNVFTDGKGRYQFTKIDTGRYFIFASNTGFVEKQSTLITVGKDSLIEVPTLLLKPSGQELAVVTVAARRPLIEHTDEKLIFNAEADPSNEGGTAIDVLRKTPFLTVDAEGNVQLNGQSNFKVLLNGKETAMFSRNLKEALQAFPASLIKKVEVITTPSAKYDGEGVAGVINIITKKKVMGYNGSIQVGRNFAQHRNFLNTNINFKLGKFGITGYYGLNKRNNLETRNANETESFNPVAFYKRFSTGTRVNDNFYNFGNLEISYDIDSLNTLSVYGNMNGGNNENNFKRNFGVISADKSDTTYTQFEDFGKGQWPSYNWGVDYIRKFKQPEQEFTFKMLHEFSKDNFRQDSRQYGESSNRFVINDNKSNNFQSTLQIDYVHPLKNKMKVEFGGKAILRKAEADYVSMIRYSEAEEFKPNESNSDNFNYRQNVYSGYVSYRFNLGKYSFRMGVRAEHTVVDGDFVKSKSKVEQDYTTFLPSVNITRKFKNIHTLSLSYSKRLSRPYIWDLNPFVNNTDSLYISYGNPNLDPEIIHSVELGYTLVKGKTNINIRLSENFSNSQIARYSFFNDATGVTSWTSDNIGSYSSTGLNGNLSVQVTNKWRWSTNMGLRYDFLKNRNNDAQKNQGLGGWFGINSNYDFSTKLSVFINGNFYQSPVQLQGRNGNELWTSVGGNYKFMKEKLVLSVQLNNPFNKEWRWRNQSQDANFRTENSNWFPWRGIATSLRWNFGKLKENVSRKRGVSNDDLRSGGNNN